MSKPKTNPKPKQVWKYDVKLNARQNGQLCQLQAELDEVFGLRVNSQEVVDLCFEQGFNFLAQKAQLVRQQKAQEAEGGKAIESTDNGTVTGEVPGQEASDSGVLANSEESGIVLPGSEQESKTDSGIILPGGQSGQG